MARPPKKMPVHVMAAFWCDAALAAEENFWTAIRAHKRELAAAEAKATQWRRERAH
jgi:hypothetical protein